LPEHPLVRARQGIVVLERRGVPLAVGTVLEGDGRILTSLSSLGGINTADIRYADRTAVVGRVGHRDPTWDFALLIPQSGRWSSGLRASEVDPALTDVRAVVLRAGGPFLVSAPLRSRPTLLSANPRDPVLLALLDHPVSYGLARPGSPLLDPHGRVTGMYIVACRPTPGPCAPLVAAAPVLPIRRFLASTPPDAVSPAPWLGIRGEPQASGTVRGVRILAVAPDSPAEKASLKPLDVIAAIDTEPVETPEQLGEAISKRPVGTVVQLLVFASGRYREVPVTLTAPPP
jgi:serine protease Do